MNQKTASAPAAENKMGTMPIGRLLFNMSLPMMVSMLVQALYNIVDSIFVAKLSENALTAVSLAFPLQMLLVAVATGTGVGMNALLSRALGAKKTDEANKIASNGTFLYIISYIVFLILGFTVVKPFYASQIGNADVEIMEMGIDYLSTVMIFSMGLLAQICFERLLTSTGRTIFSMTSQLCGAITNIILDPILIFGLIGFPKMGVTGAAVATVIGQCVGALVSFTCNHKFNPDVRLQFRGFRPDGKIIRTIYAIGIPSIIMQSIAQEGAIQIFQEFNTGMEEIIVGVVGVLQFDVLKYRLQNEYNVEIRLENLPYEYIRWIENEEIDMDRLSGTSDMKKIMDLKGRPLLLFAHEWSIRMTEERNEGLILSEFGRS